MKLRAALLRRSALMTTIALLPWAVAVVAYATMDPFAASALAVPMIVIGALVSLLIWFQNPLAREERLDVEVTDAALRIGSRVVPRRSIAKADLLIATGSPAVRISRRFAPAVDVLVGDEDQAHRLLGALGFDASQRAARYRLPTLLTVRPWLALLLGVPVVALAAFVDAAHVGLAFAAFGVFAALALWPASLVVGADALVLRWLWTRRIIPTKDVVRVTRFTHRRRRGVVQLAGLRLRLRGGRAVTLPVWSPFDDRALTMVERRVVDAVALARGHAEASADALARGDLGFREWVARLRALGTGEAADLRTAAVVPEQLWRVADDPAQRPDARAAAAVALAPTLDETGRTRLEELARATAAPKLRVALERAAGGADDEALEDALREVSLDCARSRAT